jgi:hypothetical protein
LFLLCSPPLCDDNMVVKLSCWTVFYDFFQGMPCLIASMYLDATSRVLVFSCTCVSISAYRACMGFGSCCEFTVSLMKNKNLTRGSQLTMLCWFAMGTPPGRRQRVAATKPPGSSLCCPHLRLHDNPPYVSPLRLPHSPRLYIPSPPHLRLRQHTTLALQVYNNTTAAQEKELDRS